MIRALIGAFLATGVLAAKSADSVECEEVIFEETPIRTCTVDLENDDLRLWHLGPDGAPLRSLGAVADLAEAEGDALLFAMNAGMYHEDRSAVGLLIVEGEEQHRIVTSAGPGNFGMLPNGVFCWSDGKGQVIESRAFAQTTPPCRYATQSGPMLVFDDELHPRFLADSTSRRIRNGVGMRADGRTAVFALSTRPVTFHRFARFFRNRMETPNALYLDGSISRMHAPLMNRPDRSGNFGPILGVVGKP